MRTRFTVTAQRLHRCRVKLQHETLRRASLFPFFDLQGEVHRVMLVWPKSPRILLLDHWPGRFRVPRWGGVTVDADLDLEPDADLDRAHAVASLRHYDPWWLLTQPRYREDPVLPVLRETNHVGETELRFTPDLQHVDSPVDEVVRAPHNPDDEDPRPRPRSTWSLRSFWRRG